MTQLELARLLAQHTDTSQSLAQASIYTLTAIITAALQHGESVRLEHLGSFRADWRPPYTANAWGRARPVAGRWIIRFEPSPRLLKAISEARKPPALPLWGETVDVE